MNRSIRRLGLSALLLSTAGCAQMCAAEDVAMGVARLTTLNADAITNDELLTLDVDVLAPCAREDQITRHNAHQVRARVIVEGANGPTTSNADAILHDNGVLVIPDILANAGGVTVSYFEWVQDRMGYFWTLDMVEERLDRMMRDAFDRVMATAEKHGVPPRIGAYVLGVEKVHVSLKLRGIYA